MMDPERLKEIASISQTIHDNTVRGRAFSPIMNDDTIGKLAEAWGVSVEEAAEIMGFTRTTS